MVSVAEAFVTMRPDFDGFGRQAEAGVRRGMGGIAKVAVGAIAAVGVGRLIGDAIGDAGESRKIARLTEQSIKTTGKAANVSAKQVGSMSEELGVMAGVDDEVIQQGANLLLTFKNVRNEAGKGGKIFERATKAGLDMAAQGFGTPTTNAVQLGKALQDPLKGITALGRAGVTFSEDQKKQIKALVESNDLLGAQKVILDEVEGQVGGAARASADPMARLSVVTGNLKEQMGTALLPVIDRVATFMADKLPGAVKAVTTAFDKDGLAGVFGLLTTKIREALPGIREKLGELLARIGDWIVNTGLPWLGEKLAEWGRALNAWIEPRIGPMLEKLGELLNRALVWMVETGLPKLATKLGEWGAAFVAWIIEAIPNMLTALGEFLTSLLGFSRDEARPRVESAWSKIGSNLVDAFWQGIKDEWPNMLSKLNDLTNSLLFGGFISDALANEKPVQLPPGELGGDFETPQRTGSGGGVQALSLPRGVSVGSITINNPVKATVEEDLPKALRRASWMVPS